MFDSSRQVLVEHADLRMGNGLNCFIPKSCRIRGSTNPTSGSREFFTSSTWSTWNANYRLEPNVRFSPDKKLVVFTSNMFGPSYVFGVETEKSASTKASSRGEF
jgi:oligogalacturonide lyase